MAALSKFVPPPPRADLSLVLGASPTDISLSELTAFAREIEQAIETEANAAGEPLGAESVPVLSLVGVEQGSTVLKLVLGPMFTPSAGRILAALKSGGELWRNIALPAQEAVAKAINRLVDRHSWVRIDSHLKGVPDTGRFDGTHRPPEVVRDLFVVGQTEYAVEVVRAGGIRPAALVKIIGSDQRIPVRGRFRDLIQQLGKNLYGKAVLIGDATWKLPDWKLVGFHVHKVAVYPEVQPGEVLAELRQLFGPTVEQIGGLPAFVKEFRTDEEDEGE